MHAHCQQLQLEEDLWQKVHLEQEEADVSPYFTAKKLLYPGWFKLPDMKYYYKLWSSSPLLKVSIEASGPDEQWDKKRVPVSDSPCRSSSDSLLGSWERLNIENAEVVSMAGKLSLRFSINLVRCVLLTWVSKSVFMLSVTTTGWWHIVNITKIYSRIIYLLLDVVIHQSTTGCSMP